MKVSVVIPALNEAEYIPQCLASVREFSTDAIAEILVVDAGSSDDTVALATRAGAKVLTKVNGTIAGQRNLGADVASGELIAFIDADCTIDRGWLENGVRHFRDPCVVSAGSPPGIPDCHATWVQKTWSFLACNPQAAESDVAWLPSANLWVRKSSFKEVGGFNEKLETCEDADLGFRLKRIGRIISDPDIRAQHHREPATLGQFYRKEVWHGKHSYDGIAGGRFTIQEVPSLVTPIIFAVSIILAVLGLAVGESLGRGIAMAGLIGVSFPPLAYTLRALIQKGRWSRFPQFLLIYFVYFAARTDALLRWLGRCVFSSISRKRVFP